MFCFKLRPIDKNSNGFLHGSLGIIVASYVGICVGITVGFRYRICGIWFRQLENAVIGDFPTGIGTARAIASAMYELHRRRRARVYFLYKDVERIALR